MVESLGELENGEAWAADEGAVVVKERGGTEPVLAAVQPALMGAAVLCDVASQTEGYGGVTRIVLELWHNALNGAIASSAVTSISYIPAEPVLSLGGPDTWTKRATSTSIVVRFTAMMDSK